MQKNQLSFFLLTIVYLTAPLEAQEQNPSLIEREQQRKEGGYFPKQTPQTSEEGSLTTEEQQANQDFGIIHKAHPPRYFQASSETSFEWDSNALLTPTNPRDSAIIIERVNLRYNRELAPQWTISSTLRQQFFWFTEIPSNDFLGQSFDTELGYQVRDVLPKFRDYAFDPRYYLGSNLYRYEDTNTGDQLVKSAVIRGGTDHAIPLFHGHCALFYGYVGNLESTSPKAFTKHQHQVFGGWAQNLIPRHLSLQAYYRFSFSDYLDVKRQDKNHLLGTTLNFRINEYLGLSGFCNYTRNDSNTADYQNFVAGIQFNANYRF